jgi:hypothetical protein
MNTVTSYRDMMVSKGRAGPGTVAHTYNHSYLRDGDWEHGDSKLAWAKVIKTPSPQISQAWWHMSEIPAIWEV